MARKVLVYEVPDGTNRKFYLSEDETQARVVTLEVNGEPTGFCVPLHIMRIQIPGMPSFPVNWNEAVRNLEVSTAA